VAGEENSNLFAEGRDEVVCVVIVQRKFLGKSRALCDVFLVDDGLRSHRGSLGLLRTSSRLASRDCRGGLAPFVLPDRIFRAWSGSLCPGCWKILEKLAQGGDLSLVIQIEVTDLAVLVRQLPVLASEGADLVVRIGESLRVVVRSPRACVRRSGETLRIVVGSLVLWWTEVRVDGVALRGACIGRSSETLRIGVGSWNLAGSLVLL